MYNHFDSPKQQLVNIGINETQVTSYNIIT